MEVVYQHDDDVTKMLFNTVIANHQRSNRNAEILGNTHDVLLSPTEEIQLVLSGLFCCFAHSQFAAAIRKCAIDFTAASIRKHWRPGGFRSLTLWRLCDCRSFCRRRRRITGSWAAWNVAVACMTSPFATAKSFIVFIGVLMKRTVPRIIIMQYKNPDSKDKFIFWSGKARIPDTSVIRLASLLIPRAGRLRASATSSYTSIEHEL